jgi:hypothetical protein
MIADEIENRYDAVIGIAVHRIRTGMTEGRQTAHSDDAKRET